jgi:hypothetical protein
MITLFFKHIDISLHYEYGKISIENLYWVIENLILYKLILVVLFYILGVNFGLSLKEHFYISLLDYGEWIVFTWLNFLHIVSTSLLIDKRLVRYDKLNVINGFIIMYQYQKL